MGNRHEQNDLAARQQGVLGTLETRGLVHYLKEETDIWFQTIVYTQQSNLTASRSALSAEAKGLDFYEILQFLKPGKSKIKVICQILCERRLCLMSGGISGN